MDLAPQKRYVYLLSSDTGETTAFLCPYRTFQQLNQIYGKNPAKYDLRKDFFDMQSALEKEGRVEMMRGTLVSRYEIQN